MVGVVLPNGEKHDVPMIKTVNEVLQDLKGSKAADYSLVFYGEKLENNVRLSDVNQLNNSNVIYLICGDNQNQQSIDENLEEVNKELASCKMLQSNISADEQKKVYRYCSNPENLKRILAENPVLFTDQLAFDLVHDFRLFTEFVINKENLAREHPHCMKLYKNVVESAIGRPSPVTNIFAQNPFGQASSSSSVITHDMLQQAMASVFNGLGVFPVQPQNNGSSSSETERRQSQQVPSVVQQDPINQNEEEPMEVDYNHLRANYQAQLEQMREFGFNNDEENLRALQACDGVLEAALELVIALRE